MEKHVLVVGAGVAGLTVAHELLERGFGVTVIERNALAGGKARSFEVRDRHGTLPGEHGFRFFPGFYQHVFDTMKRIPTAEGKRVFDNLVPADLWYVCFGDRRLQHFPARIPTNTVSARATYRFLRQFLSGDFMDIPLRDHAYLAAKLWVLLSSSERRQEGEWEDLAFIEFFDDPGKSAGYRKLIRIGPLIFVACASNRMSARTGGALLYRLLASTTAWGSNSDRVLNAPTNEAWIDPWVRHLQGMGLQLLLDCKLEAVRLRDGGVAGFVVEGVRGTRVLEADAYVMAVPPSTWSDVMPAEVFALDPSLRGIGRIETDWMAGVQFFFETDVRVARGHGLFVDSPWMLTTISQKQFWRPELQFPFGGKMVEGILSVIISDWHTPGLIYGKAAKECSRPEIEAEILHQLERCLPAHIALELRGAGLLATSFDSSLVWADGVLTNLEPIIVNTKGSWRDRPTAGTRLPNLFVAGDFARTQTDLATMEGANESARHAVNALLAANGRSRTPCKTWSPPVPLLTRPIKALDARMVRRGLRHPLESLLRVGRAITSQERNRASE